MEFFPFRADVFNVGRDDGRHDAAVGGAYDSALHAGRPEKNTPIVAKGVFVAGYAVAWTGFSLSASILRWGFELLALLSPKMAIANPFFGRGLLIAAGAYQWTPLKDRCLGNCRSPMAFLTHSWRDGGGGAFRMGLEHGLYSVGCCWVMMGLLFLGGVMNLLWIAAITAFVLLEQLSPIGIQGGWFSGFLLIVSGLLVIGLA
mgnify:CR=1 FL=1